MKSHRIANIQNYLDRLENMRVYPSTHDGCKDHLAIIFGIIPKLKNDFEQLMDEIL